MSLSFSQLGRLKDTNFLHLSTYITLTMTSLKVTNSSAIASLNVDELEQTAQVEFKNGGKYTYFGVAKDAIRNLIYKSTPDTSVGQWVNNNLLSAGCRYQFGFEG